MAFQPPEQQQQREQDALLQLPPGVMLRIWEQLQHASPSQAALHASQHALLCTCKALRALCSPWIEATMAANVSELDEHPVNHEQAWDAVMHKASARLACVPRGARLVELKWYAASSDPHMQLLLSGVLPAFLYQHSARCRNITSVDIKYDLELTYGDLAAVVNTCPSLQHVKVSNSSVVGPVFAPLGLLKSLSTLKLHNTFAVRSFAHVEASLRELTHLDRLTVSAPSSWRRHASACYLGSPELLPWVQGLRGLRHLHLDWGGGFEEGEAHDATDAVVRHLSALQHLTSLAVDGCHLTPCHLNNFACLDKLVSLVLPCQRLDSPSVLLLASLPKLGELHVRVSEPDADLSHLSCSWTKLTLDDTTNSLESLAWLPLGQLQELHRSEDEWWDLDASDGVEATRTLLQRVAAMMGRLRQLQPMSMGFDWDERPEQPCASLLAAMAPMQQHLTSLSLGVMWPLGEADVQEGAKHLPGLDQLRVHLSGPGVGAFLLALEGVSWVRELVLLPMDPPAPDEDAQAHGEALEKLVSSRDAAGVALTVIDERDAF